MNELLPFLVRHGYAVVFLWVFAEQIGLPVPSTIILLAAGAVAGAGDLNLGGVLVVAVVASMISDLIWYEIGRKRGMSVLGLLCRISLEPDSCVRRTEDRFARNRAKTILIAKFIPGLSTAAPPLAGMFGMPLARFLLFDTAGALLWVGSSTLVGFVFCHQLEQLLLWTRRLGVGVVSLFALGILVYLGWKYVQRRRFLRELTVATVSPEEVREKLERKEPLHIVDLRHALDLEADPGRLPGAVHVSPERIQDLHRNLPLDRDIVLYCT